MAVLIVWFNTVGSMFGETFAAAIESSLQATAKYGDLLDQATVTQNFGEEDLDLQLQQVAKLISIRSQLVRTCMHMHARCLRICSADELSAKQHPVIHLCIHQFALFIQQVQEL